MGGILLKLSESLSKNIQAIMPLEKEKTEFRERLLLFLKNLHIKELESEEFQKNLIKDFLQSCLPKSFINTSKRTDLAIYNGNSPNSTVGVLIETKSVSNKVEMMSKDKINTKAFQELIHYYFQERITHNNIELKKCIITNGYEWFIIEAKDIDTLLYKNKQLYEMYTKWQNGQLIQSTTDFLYKEVISPAIDIAIEKGIKITYFDLREALKKGDETEIKQTELTRLYRFFSAENLLNKEIFSDSNKLNKRFYDELLYLMGLEEVKKGNQKLIQRLPREKRQKGTFVENILDKLQMSDMPEVEQYDAAVQLTVIWVNRILFLKLVESQLVSFNGDDEEYRFLSKDKISTFDDFYHLFFGVLAKRPEDRNTELREKYPHVPYLNSSLFEPTDLETSKNGLSIDRLRELQIDFYDKTVLKGANKKKKQGSVQFLTYLFEFLNAYDISTSAVKGKNISTLINASVLGLIFEKINGYKDGSYFTPSFITMYMSKNAVRIAVINKVNEVKGWDCKTLDDLDYYITNKEIAQEISNIIDTITFCDPAVGSGHFLVSILNEILAIKSYLHILFDVDGRIMNDVMCTVINDELVVRDTNGEDFKYRCGNAYAERVQKSIFHEKKKIIENCLFGVDINLNSVNICRLRLWIELLKHSYYDTSEAPQLITLPNIDINIKVGNSLVQKYQLDEKLDKRFTDFKEYFQMVNSYKNTNNKAVKNALIKSIADMKQNFKNNLLTPEFMKVAKLTRELNKVRKNGDLFFTKKEQKEFQKNVDKAILKLKAAEDEYEKSGNYPLYARGLEWRMEFPEILDEDGNYIGFDVIIANPPYIYSTSEQFSDLEKKYFADNYVLSEYQANTYGLFLELSIDLLKKDGYCSMIIPNTVLTISQYKKMRNYLLENMGDMLILNSKDKLFEDASVDNCIINFRKSVPSTVELFELEKNEIYPIGLTEPTVLQNMDVINFAVFSGDSAIIQNVLDTMDKNSKPIHENYGIVKDGLKAYERNKGIPRQPEDKDAFEEFKKQRTFFSKERVDSSYRKFLDGADITRYGLNWSGEYLSYGVHLAGKRNPKIFEGERLLIRRIPNKSEYMLMAAYTDGEYVHEQSIEVVHELLAPPLFLLGVLNSKVESFWAVHKFDFLQRKIYPQMRLYQIQEFPIPNASDDEQKVLSLLVENYLKALCDNEETEELTRLNNDIDEYVMDLYRLKEEEKIIIRNFNI